MHLMWPGLPRDLPPYFSIINQQPANKPGPLGTYGNLNILPIIMYNDLSQVQTEHHLHHVIATPLRAQQAQRERTSSTYMACMCPAAWPAVIRAARQGAASNIAEERLQIAATPLAGHPAVPTRRSPNKPADTAGRLPSDWGSLPPSFKQHLTDPLPSSLVWGSCCASCEQQPNQPEQPPEKNSRQHERLQRQCRGQVVFQQPASMSRSITRQRLPFTMPCPRELRGPHPACCAGTGKI
jgi:hypothetical protein